MEDERESSQTPPRKKSKTEKEKKSKAQQKFRDEWLQQPEFRDWLDRVLGDFYKAKCKLCDEVYTADISVLKGHAKTKKHINKLQPSKSTPKITQFFSRSDDNTKKLTDAIKNAEIKLAGFCTEHDIPMNVFNHLPDTLKDAFPDSKVAQGLAMKRTKVTAVITNVIGETETSEMAEKLHTTKFSILTDESTDISAKKNNLHSGEILR